MCNVIFFLVDWLNQAYIYIYVHFVELYLTCARMNNENLSRVSCAIFLADGKRCAAVNVIGCHKGREGVNFASHAFIPVDIK